ncbi:Hypothetical_protein [Hexamita inflata]|uniref:Hypothetical_protein n=1 Tax=Hexamita inflata TaxID=28002 RepID=A0AA86U789_9EUKA|nr:Hypothetical protein HINF_LOCUS31454 [Hexamita inflata]
MSFEPQTPPTVGPQTYRPYNTLLDRLGPFKFMSPKPKNLFPTNDNPGANAYSPCLNPMFPHHEARLIRSKFAVKQYIPDSPAPSFYKPEIPKEGKFLSFPRYDVYQPKGNLLGPGQYEIYSTLGKNSHQFSVPREIVQQKLPERVPEPYDYDLKVIEPDSHTVRFKQDYGYKMEKQITPGPGFYDQEKKTFRRKYIVKENKQKNNEKFVQILQSEAVGEKFKKKEDQIMKQIGFSLVTMSRRRIIKEKEDRY